MDKEFKTLIDEEYADDCILNKEDIEIYDVEATYINVINKLKQLKIARNKFITGYHVRVTIDYKPRLEGFTQHISDPVGQAVEYKLDSEQEYNEFNIRLNSLYEVMSKKEIAYINDCLLCGRSETSVYSYFGICKESFQLIKASAIIRFGIAFNIVEYK